MLKKSVAGAQICIIFVLLAFASRAFALEDPLAESPNSATNLFTMQGSNTIGAHLAPLWASMYLKHAGFKDVRIEEKDSQNEYKVWGARPSSASRSMVYIDIAAHGSSTGFIGLRSGKADIAMSSRQIKPSEDDAFPGKSLRSFEYEHVVAIDGIAIVVHPDNALANLTKTQLADIFAGKIKNWRALGGEDLAIDLYARDENSGTWDTFKSLVLSSNHKLSRFAERFESNEDIADKVLSNRRGIGFVGLASVGDARAIPIATGDSAVMLPQPLLVATEDYPLSRRLYLYQNPNRYNEHAEDFLAFVQQQSAQDLAQTLGFISQKPIALAYIPEDASERYRRLTVHGKRLSINFRFKDGGADLDNKALRDIYRIAQYIDTEGNEDLVIQLVGFGDAKQDERRALALSKMRASAVKSALHHQGVTAESVIGFGANNPVAINQNEDRFKNQRVEVWVFEKHYQARLAEIKKSIFAEQKASHDSSFALQ